MSPAQKLWRREAGAGRWCVRRRCALMAIGSTASRKMINTRSSNTGADPDDEERQKCDLRRRIERRKERLDRIGEAAIPAGGETERNADHEREPDAKQKFEAAPAEIGPDFAGDENMRNAARAIKRRRRNEDRLELQARRSGADERPQQIGPPAALGAFPEHQEQHDGQWYPESRVRARDRCAAARRARHRSAKSVIAPLRHSAAIAQTAAPAGRAARHDDKSCDGEDEHAEQHGIGLKQYCRHPRSCGQARRSQRKVRRQRRRAARDQPHISGR